MPRYAQGKYWLLTIPRHKFVPYLPPDCEYIRGQLEQGESTEYLHWQVIVCFKRKVRLREVKRVFAEETHAELSRSAAATEYVWKEDTRITGTQFELGELPFKRNSRTDWEVVRRKAQEGDLLSIPPDVYVRYYHSLRSIRQDHLKPSAVYRTTLCLWGRTQLGKSRRAWHEAGMEAYAKDPRSKFWDGYQGQEHAIFDEFRGGIDVAHLLRWLDRYPVNVEIKGSSVPLRVNKYWFTSNVPPNLWYPGLDNETLDALLRRMTVINVTEEWVPPEEESGITEILDQ